MIELKILRTQEGDEALDRYGKGNEYGIKYLVLGADSKMAALQGVHEGAPRILGETNSGDPEILVYDGVRFDGYQDEGIEITAKYALEDNPDYDDSADNGEPEPSYSFDTSGGSEHITRAIAQVHFPTTAKDANKFIGWNGKSGDDCEIAGADIVVANMRESYTRIIKKSKIDNAFKRSLARVTGKVNKTAFKGWAAGEVLFLGASYSATEDDRKIAVTYNFAIRENEPAQKIGDIAIPAKKGWWVIWQMAKTETLAGKKPSLNIEGIYFAQAYKEVDFGILGIKGK